jgi:hypothetical protein
LHFAPEQAPWVEQKKSVVIGDGDAEVIANPFTQSMMRRRPKRQGQVCAKRGHDRRVEYFFKRRCKLVH